MSVRSLRVIALVAPLLGTVAFAMRQPPRAPTPIIFDRTLPAMDGQHLNMKVVDVRMPPGATGIPHSHGCAVVVFMLEGAMRMAVRGGPDSVYHRGEVFFERPTDIHQTSTNVSATDSAHYTATFVCDHTGPLSTPVPPAP